MIVLSYKRFNNQFFTCHIRPNSNSYRAFRTVRTKRKFNSKYFIENLILINSKLIYLVHYTIGNKLITTTTTQ